MDSELVAVREEGRRAAPASFPSHHHCTRCGGKATVLDDDALLCGRCFLDAALMRRRRLSRARPSYHRRA
jgi:hypothetical protein